MSKKICFDKNTFIFGIIIIFILSLFSYFINFNYKYNNNNNNNNEARLQNLINKKILNIKDKIINNHYNNDKNDKVLEKEREQKEREQREREQREREQREREQREKCEHEQQQQQKCEQEQQQQQQKCEQEQLQQQHKCEQEQCEQEIDIDTYNKVNFKNNINDRLNVRDELIKYKINDEVQQRDLNVLLNPIYPPLARVERPIFDNLIRMNFGQSTRGSEDTFRLMGYLVNSNKNDMDMGGNIWKLFGRQSYRGSSVGEFYVSPVNDHTSDMKIFLKNDMMPKDKIRDMYALPVEVYFNSPFFSKNAYTINELPKSDFNSNYL
jgi:hypothetical protein